MFSWLRKTKTVHKYLLCYFLISIIPVLILGTFFLYINMIRMNDDIENSMLLKLNQIQNRIDYGIKEMETVSLHFSTKLNLIDEYRKNGSNGFSQQLRLYKDNAGMADDVMVYLCGDSVFFNTDGAISYQDLEQYVGKENSLTMSRFFSTINNARVAAIPLVKPYPYNNRQSNLIVYKLPIPFLEESPAASMLFMIRAGHILDIIINYIGEFDGYAFIYDNNLKVIYKYDNAGKLDTKHDNTGKLDAKYDNAGRPDTEIIANDMAKLKGTGITGYRYGARRFMAMRMVSENLGFSYVVCIPYNEFYAKSQQIFRVFMTLVALTVALLLVVSAVLAARNYRPIKKLLDYITASGGSSMPPENLANADEFDRLQNVYENIAAKNSELLHQVSKQKVYVKERSLIKLLQGDIKDIDFYLRYSDICFSRDYFFVIAAGFGNASEKLENIENALYIVEEVLFENVHGYSVELFNDKIIAVIVNTDKALDTGERFDIALKLHGMFVEQGFYEVVLGVGNAYAGFKKVCSSFLEAVTALKALHDSDASPVKLFADKVQDKAGGVFNVANDRAVFIQSLLDGEEAVALRELDHMVKEISDESASFLIMQYLCIDIINSTVKTARILNADISRIDIENILFFTTAGEFRKKAEQLIRLICERMKSAQKKPELSHDDIIEYVKKYFTDYNLSLEQVSDAFKVSPSYLSGFFKKRTGYSFLQYITLLRMNYVKEQLKATELPVNEIVKSAGYIDTASFIRRFRTMEGITPGQYRRVSRVTSV